MSLWRSFAKGTAEFSAEHVTMAISAERRFSALMNELSRDPGLLTRPETAEPTAGVCTLAQYDDCSSVPHALVASRGCEGEGEGDGEDEGDGDSDGAMRRCPSLTVVDRSRLTARARASPCGRLRPRHRHGRRGTHELDRRRCGLLVPCR